MQASRALEHRKKLHPFILGGKPRSEGPPAWLFGLLHCPPPPPPTWYLLMSVVGLELYTTYWLHGTALELPLPPLGPLGHGLCLGAAALAMGLRAAHAHARWREGRSLWAELVSGCRSLASSAAGSFTDVERTERLLLHTITFAWAVRSQLRGQTLGDDVSDGLVVDGLLSDEQLAVVNGYGHAPLALLDAIRAEVNAEVHAQMRLNHGRAMGHWDLAIADDVRGLLQAMTGCERVRAAPVALYISLLPSALVLWLLVYPVVLSASLGWQPTMVLTAGAALAILTLEEIAAQMVEPFGTAPHDLPTDELCAQIERDVLEVMSRAEEHGGLQGGLQGGLNPPQAFAIHQPTTMTTPARLSAAGPTPASSGVRCAQPRSRWGDDGCAA